MAEELILDVKSNIKSVTKDTDKLGESIGDAKTQTEGLDKATKTGAKGFKGMATAVKGFGLALKAAGIGLVIALFATLKEALERNQKVMNIVNTIMTTISTTFNQVVGVLTDTVKWVTESTDRFDALGTVFESIGTVIKNVIMIAFTPLRLAVIGTKTDFAALQLGWEMLFGDDESIKAAQQHLKDTAKEFVELKDSLVNSVKEIGSAGKAIGGSIGDAIGEIGAIGTQAIDGLSKISIKSNIELAKATTAAANSSALAEAQIQGLIEKNDLLAETQRQIRDDETKTFAERIAANKELGEVLKKQKIDMMKLADARVAAALLEKNANEDNIDLQIAYQQTLNDRAGVEAQVAGLVSEQLTNEVSLNKELLESQREIAQDSLEGIDRELLELKNAYELKLEMARKAGVSDVELTEQYEKEKQAIIDAAADNEIATSEAVTDAKKASVNDQLEAGAHLAGALSSLAGDNKELAVASALIDTYVGANKALAQGGTVGFITAAAVIAAGLKNVQTILSTDVGDGGGSVPSASSAPPAPQMMSGAFELTGGQPVEPLQAYVVSDDITDSQNGLAIIRRRATI